MDTPITASLDGADGVNANDAKVCSICKRPTPDPARSISLNFLAIVGHSVKKYPLTSSVQRENWSIGAVFSPLGQLALMSHCCRDCEAEYREDRLKELKKTVVVRRYLVGLCVFALAWGACWLPFFDGEKSRFWQFGLTFLLPLALLAIGGIGTAVTNQAAQEFKTEAKELTADYLACSAGIAERLARIAGRLDVSGILLRYDMGEQGNPINIENYLLFVLDQKGDWGVSHRSGADWTGGWAHYDTYNGRRWWMAGETPLGFDYRGKRATFAMQATAPYQSGDQYGHLFQDDPNRSKHIE